MIGVFAAVAMGTPAVGFTVTPSVTAVSADAVKHNSDRIKFQTKGPTYVRVAEVVFAPGGYSGWHHHPGIVIVAVKTGTVTFTHSDCSSESYGPGTVFVEGGDDPGQASSVAGATAIATFVAPNDGPVTTGLTSTFRVDDVAVSCP